MLQTTLWWRKNTSWQWVQEKGGCVLLSQACEPCERAAQDAEPETLPLGVIPGSESVQATSFSFLRQESSGCSVARLAGAAVIDCGGRSAPTKKDF